MKAIRSKPFIISLISIITISVSYLIFLACGGGGYYWEDEYSRSYFFQKNLLPEKMSFFGRDEHFSKYDNMGDFVQINTDEWYEYFDKKISKENINTMLYNYDIKEFKIIKNQFETKIFKSVTDYTPLLQAFSNADKTKVSEFFTYMQYAKLCEPIASYNPYSWYYEEEAPRTDSLKFQSIINTGNSLFKKCDNPLIKERYLFQLIRMHYFAANNKMCQELFTKFESLFSKKTSMYIRSLGYYAGSLEDKSFANYLFSKIFMENTTMKETAYHSFAPLEETDWEATLGFAKTKEEKINLWRMFSLFTKDYERCIPEVYALNPKDSILEELVLNAINTKEESNIGLKGIIPFTNDFTNLITSIANNSNTLHPNFWNLAAGYITAINKDTNKSEQYLKAVEKSEKKDSAVLVQIRGIRILRTLVQTETITKEFETEFTKEYTWLNSKEVKTNESIQKILLWTKIHLADTYFEQKDFVKSECLYSQSLYYNDFDRLQNLLDFLDKPSKTPFEKILTASYSHNKEEIYGLQGFAKLYEENKPQEAIEFYKKSNHITLPADPFIIHLTDCHDCDQSEFQEITYSQETLLKKIIELQKTAVTNKAKAAESYFLLGNAYYNMTYYGNSRAMYESDIFWYNWGYDQNVFGQLINSYTYNEYTFWSPSFIAEYSKEGLQYIPLDCSRAKEYYVKAMDASNNKEFKAKCCMMAAKCEYAEDVNQGKLTYDQYFIPGEFYKKMVKDYSKTKYYQEAINECGYFRDYVQGL